MQNTIVKEFEDHPDVVTFLFNEGGLLNEDYNWMKTFWDNVYLRGTVVHDSVWVAANQYLQPNTNLPFGRGFIIDRDGTVALPYFGHNPDLVIDAIYGLLDGTSVPADGETPAGTALHLANSPNPTDSHTTVTYMLNEPGAAAVRIYDVAGREVALVREGEHEAGEHSVVWDGRDERGVAVASGVYFVRLDTVAGVLGRKLVLVR